MKTHARRAEIIVFAHLMCKSREALTFIAIPQAPYEDTPLSRK